MAFSENRTRKIRRWRINVAAATAAAPATKNNKIISSKRFDTFALWHLKVKRKHINTLIDVFNRANHALLLLSFYCNFHQGCNCFFSLFCWLIVAWSPPIFRRTMEKENNIQKCVECTMIHRLQHEKSDLVTRTYDVLLRVIHFF